MATNTLEAVKRQAAHDPLLIRKPPSNMTVESLSDEDQALLEILLTEPAFFMDHPDFAKAGIERKLFGGVAKFVKRNGTRFIETDDQVLDAVASGGRVPTLNHEQEQLLFMRFNYARSQTAKILNESTGKPLTGVATRQLLAWGHRVRVARGAIVRINLPLVIAMAKRTRLSNIDFNEMISEGNMALLRSVEKFDCSRGFKFSTYSCRAILKSFSRVAMRASRYRGKFPTEFDPSMERSDFLDRKRDHVEEDCVDELKQILMANMAELSDVEHTVIIERFAIGKPAFNGADAPKTLEQVGHIIGVTKERVRQIQNKALKKIRGALEEHYLAA